MKTFSVLLMIALVTYTQAYALLKENKLTGAVPMEVDYCEGSPMSNMTGWQGSLDESPLKGKPLDMHLTSTAIADLTMTKVTLSAWSMGVNLHEHDITQGVQATAAAGDTVSFNYSYPIPTFFPAGDYEIHLSFMNGSDMVECGKFNLHFD